MGQNRVWGSIDWDSWLIWLVKPDCANGPLLFKLRPYYGLPLARGRHDFASAPLIHINCAEEDIVAVRFIDFSNPIIE